MDNVVGSLSLPGCGRIVVVGEPGVGKSRLAVALADALKGRAIDYYFSVDADPFFNSTETFHRFLCAELAGKWDVRDRSNEDNPALMAKLFLDALAEAGDKAARSKKTQVIIVDGIEESSECQQLLDSLVSTKGTVFVIFAQHGVVRGATFGTEEKRLALDSRLSDEEALSLLEYRLGRSLYDENRHALRNAVNSQASRLPLFLAMLAEEVKATHAVPTDWAETVAQGYFVPRTSGWTEQEMSAMSVCAYVRRLLGDVELAEILGLERHEINGLMTRPSRFLVKGTDGLWRFRFDRWRQCAREWKGGLSLVVDWASGWAQRDPGSACYDYAMECLPYHLSETQNRRELVPLLTKLGEGRGINDGFIRAKAKWLRDRNRPLLNLGRDYQWAMESAADNDDRLAFVELFVAREALYAEVEVAGKTALQQWIERKEIKHALETAEYMRDSSRATLFVACGSVLSTPKVQTRELKEAVRKHVRVAGKLQTFLMAWLAKELDLGQQLAHETPPLHPVDEDGLDWGELNNAETFLTDRILASQGILFNGEFEFDNDICAALAALKVVHGEDWLDDLFERSVAFLQEDEHYNIAADDISGYFFPFVSDRLRESLWPGLLERYLPDAVLLALHRSGPGKLFLKYYARRAFDPPDISPAHYGRTVHQAILVFKRLGDRNDAERLAKSALQRLAAYLAGRDTWEVDGGPVRWLAHDIVGLVAEDGLAPPESEAFKHLKEVVEEDAARIGQQQGEARGAGQQPDVALEEFLFRPQPPTQEEVRSMVRQSLAALDVGVELRSPGWRYEVDMICSRARLLSEPCGPGESFYSRLGCPFGRHYLWRAFIEELFEKPGDLERFRPDLERIALGNLSSKDAESLGEAVTAATALARLDKPEYLATVADAIVKFGLQELACHNQETSKEKELDESLARLIIFLGKFNHFGHPLFKAFSDWDRNWQWGELRYELATLQVLIARKADGAEALTSRLRDLDDAGLLRTIELLGDTAWLNGLEEASLFWGNRLGSFNRRTFDPWFDWGGWSKPERRIGELLLNVGLSQEKPVGNARDMAPLIQALLVDKVPGPQFFQQVSQCLRGIADGGKDLLILWLEGLRHNDHGALWNALKGRDYGEVDWLLTSLAPFGPEGLLDKQLIRWISGISNEAFLRLANGMAGARDCWGLMIAAADCARLADRGVREGLFRRILGVLSDEGGDTVRAAVQLLLENSKESARTGWARELKWDDEARTRAFEVARAAELEKERSESPQAKLAGEVRRMLEDQYDLLLRFAGKRFDVAAMVARLFSEGASLKLLPNAKEVIGAAECMFKDPEFRSNSILAPSVVFNYSKGLELELQRLMRPFADWFKAFRMNGGDVPDEHTHGTALANLIDYAEGKPYKPPSLGQAAWLLRAIKPFTVAPWLAGLRQKLNDMMSSQNIWTTQEYDQFLVLLSGVVDERNKVVHPQPTIDEQSLVAFQKRFWNCINLWAGWVR